MHNLSLAPTDDGLQRHTYNCVGVEGLLLSNNVLMLLLCVYVGAWTMLDGRDTSENEDLWSPSPNAAFTPVGLNSPVLENWRRKGFQISLALQGRGTLAINESDSEGLMR